MVLIVCKRGVRVDRMVLCFLDIVHGGAITFEILQARLDSVFDLSAPCSWNAVVGIDALSLLLQRTVEEGDVDSIARFSAGVRRSEGDMAFRMPILRRGDKGPLMNVEQIIDLWQDG